MKSLVFATNNLNKIQEVKNGLINTIDILSLKDISCFEELPETARSIEGNSKQKAIYVFEKYNCDCFSDDSGLEVFALNGAPGVDSAHYCGQRNDAKNITLLLNNLRNVKNREAQFKTVFTLVTSDFVEQFTGIVTGIIAKNQQGRNGFGYDSIFIPQGTNRTFGQMSRDEKAIWSHRAKAYKLLTSFIQLHF